MEASQRTGKNRLHEAKRSEAETELALPDRQHDVDEICVTVMQGVRATGDAERSALFLFCASRRDGCGHGVTGRRSTKVVLMNDSTVSPCWLMPVEWMLSSPTPGRLSETLASITSLA